MSVAPLRATGRSPEVAARAWFAERKRAQVRTGRSLAPRLTRAVRFQDGHPAIVHGEHHGGGSALLGDTADDVSGSGQAEAETSRFFRTDRAKQSSQRQSADGFGRE